MFVCASGSHADRPRCGLQNLQRQGTCLDPSGGDAASGGGGCGDGGRGNPDTDLEIPRREGISRRSAFTRGFPRGSAVENPPANAADTGVTGLTPGLGRSPGGGHGNPLQDSCLENPMDRGAWWARVHGVTKSRTGLKGLITHAAFTEQGRILA